MDYMALAAQLRATRQAEDQARQQQAQAGGAATSSGGMVGPSFGSTGGFQPQNQPQQTTTGNPLQTGIDAYSKYRDMSKLLRGGGAAAGGFTGASPATMAAMGSGGGSSLGSIGLMSSAPAVSYPGAATAGGSSLGAGGAGAGAMGSAGPLAGLAALSFLGDKEMNENKGSMINADKLNNMGTIGGSGIGLRIGDFGNAFNPATWVSDPKKAGKAIVNAFTLGFLDKFM